jgi:hypothetical protein
MFSGMQQAGGRMSFGLFLYVLALLFSRHLAWRFSGEMEKEYIPFFTVFFLSAHCRFHSRNFVVVGR